MAKLIKKVLSSKYVKDKLEKAKDIEFKEKGSNKTVFKINSSSLLDLGGLFFEGLQLDDNKISEIPFNNYGSELTELNLQNSSLTRIDSDI